MPRRRRFARPDWADEFEAAGHQIPADGTIIVYHATTAAKAKHILAEGVLRRPKDAPDSYGVYFSISPEVAENYGDGTLVALRVPVEDLSLDDIFPSGRMDFHARTHQGVYMPLALEVIPAKPAKNPLPTARVVAHLRKTIHTDDPEFIEAMVETITMYDQWVLEDVPLDEIELWCAFRKDAEKYAREDLDAFPPIILVPATHGLVKSTGRRWHALDGAHRACAFAIAGRRTIPAYRPIDDAARNPQVAGWITPDGEFIPMTHGEHFHIAAKRLGLEKTPRATREALKRGWVRLGDMTVQFSAAHKRRSLLMARDFYREVFGGNPPAYSVMVEWNVEGELWNPEYTLVSYEIPVADFLEIEGVGDLMRYPHTRIYTETWEG